jgi:hypothetical protein
MLSRGAEGVTMPTASRESMAHRWGSARGRPVRDPKIGSHTPLAEVGRN